MGRETDEWVSGLVDEWTDEQVGEWMDGCQVGRLMIDLWMGE